MATIRQLLNQKGGKVCSIGPDATVFDAVAKMAENDIGSLTVMDSEVLIGIITERRYARNVVERQDISINASLGDHGERRCHRGAGTIRRRMHGADDRAACAPSASRRRRKSNRHRFDGRSGKKHY